MYPAVNLRAFYFIDFWANEYPNVESMFGAFTKAANDLLHTVHRNKVIAESPSKIKELALY